MISFRSMFLLAVVAAAGCQPAAPPAANSGAPPAPPPPAAGVESGEPQEVSDPEARLVAAYKAAHASKDVEAMLKLYWFGSADAEMQQTIRENVEGELRCPLTDIKIVPVEPGQHGPREEGGIRWRPSLEVVALLTANFDTSRAPVGGYHTQQVKLTVGRHGGKCYFTAPIRE